MAVDGPLSPTDQKAASLLFILPRRFRSSVAGAPCGPGRWRRIVRDVRRPPSLQRDVWRARRRIKDGQARLRRARCVPVRTGDYGNSRAFTGTLLLCRRSASPHAINGHRQ